jgi:GNAT superfamily N-acetyltransferase
MALVLELRCSLDRRPDLPRAAGVTLRTFGGDDDIDRWLNLRHRAFAREKLGVRHWERSDFETEFRAKSWWNPAHVWFVETVESLAEPVTVGTVTLAFRGNDPGARPVVHWLAVLPGWRRRGVGRLLMARLHQACWDLGYRDVWVETHVQWAAAVRLYESLGYRAEPQRLAGE